MSRKRRKQKRPAPDVYTIIAEPQDMPVNRNVYMPLYRYRFEGKNAKSGDHFLEKFMPFLEANEYLATEKEQSHAYIDGFSTALSVIALYFDSLELLPEDRA